MYYLIGSHPRVVHVPSGHLEENSKAKEEKHKNICMSDPVM